jgi:hypothetical protein
MEGGGLAAIVMPEPITEKRRAAIRMNRLMSTRFDCRPRLARTGAAVAGLSLLLAGLSACGNLVTVTHAGLVGITVDAARRPVIAVVTCDRSTPVIDMAEGRKESDPDTKPNVERGQWKARTAFTGVTTFPLADPGENWVTVRSPGALSTDRLFVVEGGTAEDEHASLAGVSFRIADLARLTPGQVQVDGKIESLSAFGAYQCH